MTISEVMQEALNDLGSSTDSLYTLPSGESGNAQQWHNVYGRKGKQCKICKSEIKKITQKDRSTFTCQKCQK
jgi:formamidopyrimidine-DNA glycosylase